MQTKLADAIKKLNAFHLVLFASAIAFALTRQVSWPLITLVLGTLICKAFSKFIPAREDDYLKALKAIEAELSSQRTDISKLNLLLGIGNIKRSQESVIQSVVGQKVNLP